MKPIHHPRSIYLLFLVFILLTSNTFAQQSNIIKPVSRIDKEFLVVVHIVVNKDSIAGISEAEILSAIAGANTAFAPIGAKFTVCEFRKIYNFQYLLRDDTNSVQIYRENVVPERINIFYIDEIKTRIGACGLFEETDGGFEGLFIKKNECNNEFTMAHELGHFFGLPHTFEGRGEELADGSNCSTAGDKICDTPADPYNDEEPLDKYVNQQCIFTSDKKDAKGKYYDPDVSNIMGYYSHCQKCLKFTLGQLQKMADNYLLRKDLW